MQHLVVYGSSSSEEDEPKATANQPPVKKIRRFEAPVVEVQVDEEVPQIAQSKNLFSRLPQPKSSANKSTPIIPLAVIKSEVERIQEDFFTIHATKDDFRYSKPLSPAVGPLPQKKSASSAYAVNIDTNGFLHQQETQEALIDQSSLLIPKHDLKNGGGAIQFVEVNQSDVGNKWDRDRLSNLSQTEREIAQQHAFSLANSGKLEGEKGSGSTLYSLAQEAAANSLKIKEQASIRRSNQLASQQKYGW